MSFVFNPFTSNFDSVNTGTVNAVGTLDSESTPSADGATISTSGLALILQSASASVPGVVNTTTQVFAGQKTMTNPISLTNGSNVTETWTGPGSSGFQTWLWKNTGSAMFLQNSGISFVTTNYSSLGTVSFNGTFQDLASVEVNGLASKVGLLVQNSATTPGDLANFKASGGTILAKIDSVGNISGTNLTAAGHALIDLALAGGTMTGAIDMGSHQIHSVTDPSSAQDAATKSYVDAAVAALNPAVATYAATTANIAGTYLNGVAGVGATFTATATGVFTVDGVTPPISARILIKDQSTGFQNGVYNLTTLGALGISAIFTRALDYNTASDMNGAGLIPVINGTVNALSAWQQVSTITTVGTDALVFQEFTANPSLYLLKANNLTDLASRQTSLNNLAGAVTSTFFLRGNGTNVSMAAIQAADVPTLNQNTSGNAATVTTNANLTGPITSSGNATSIASQTGTGTKFVVDTSPVLITPDLGTPSACVATNLTGTAASLTAGKATNVAGGLGGQVHYQSAANTTAFLANGTAGQYLQANGTTLAPTWVTPTASGVSTGVTHTANLTTTAGNFTVFTSALWDLTSSYNTSTGVFTCPSSGIYDVTIAGCQTTSAGPSMWLAKNGVANTSGAYCKIFDASTACRSGSVSIQCVTNDTLTIVPDTTNTLQFTTLSGIATGNRTIVTFSKR